MKHKWNTSNNAVTFFFSHLKRKIITEIEFVWFKKKTSKKLLDVFFFNWKGESKWVEGKEKFESIKQESVTFLD